MSAERGDDVDAGRPHLFERMLVGPLGRWPALVWTACALLAAAPFLWAHFESLGPGATDAEAAERAFDFTIPGVLLTLTVLLVPLGFSLCRAILAGAAEELPGFLESATDDGRDPRAWVLEELAFFRGTRAMIPLALAWAVAAPLCYHFAGFFAPVAHLPGTWTLYLSMAVAAAMAGAALVAVYEGARLVWRLGYAFRIRHLQRSFGAQSIGSALFDCYIVVCVIWLSFALSAAPVMSDATGPMALFAVPVALFLLASFFICQQPLHYRMRDAKRARIVMLQDRLKRRFDDLSPFARSREIEEIEFLRRELALALDAPEWPFTRRVLIGNGLVSLVAILGPPLASLASGDIEGLLTKLTGS